MPEQIYVLWEGYELLGLFKSLRSAMIVGDARGREWAINGRGAWESTHSLTISIETLND